MPLSSSTVWNEFPGDENVRTVDRCASFGAGGTFVRARRCTARDVRTLAAKPLSSRPGEARDGVLVDWIGPVRALDLEASPAEEARVDRPGAGSEQRKRQTQHPDHQAVPPVGGLPISRDE